MTLITISENPVKNVDKCCNYKLNVDHSCLVRYVFCVESGIWNIASRLVCNDWFTLWRKLHWVLENRKKIFCSEKFPSIAQISPQFK